MSEELSLRELEAKDELTHSEEMLRQMKEFNQTGTRRVDCPECGAEKAVSTEIDNEKGRCGACGEVVHVGRFI